MAAQPGAAPQQQQTQPWVTTETDTSPTTVENENILLQPFSTLDEPVMDTIMRDASAVYSKLKIVLLPLDRETPFGYAGVSQDSNELVPGDNQRLVLNRLKEWDLWGPLLVCLSLSVMLAIRSPPAKASQVFAAVFMTVWVGSSVVTVNAQLLGGSISFFQSLCVLGYCVFPLLVSATIIFLVELFGLTKTFVGWLNILWILVGFVWATRASSVFIGQYIVPERRALAVFPVFFFYTFLGWLILLF